MMLFLPNMTDHSAVTKQDDNQNMFIAEKNTPDTRQQRERLKIFLKQINNLPMRGKKYLLISVTVRRCVLELRKRRCHLASETLA